MVEDKPAAASGNSSFSLASPAVSLPKAGTVDLSDNEQRELVSRSKDKKESLRSSLVTAYRWVFHPDEDRLTVVGLPVPATAAETIADRTVKRLSDMDYGHPKVMEKLSAVFFNSRIVPRVWKDEENVPLDLEELCRRFRQWTYLPILPKRDDTLRACIREGFAQDLWAVAIGDNATLKYTKLIEEPSDLDGLQTLFDGSASLVKGALRQLIRDELAPSAPPAQPPPEEVDYGPRPPSQGGRVAEPQPPTIPPPARRLTRVRIRLDGLPITKTGNLQPYLFKVIQEQDAGAELVIEIDVRSEAGVSEEALEKRIVEGLDQLGIQASWEG